jgi:3-methyladenine DNA glycosylase AlkD
VDDDLRTAADVVARLRDLASELELAKMTKRLPSGESAFGVRMRDLFDTAKSAVGLSPDELDELFANDAFEPRMAAFCILDFSARQRPDIVLRQSYLDHHDAITTWDMVDRAAPWVVGAATAGGPYDVLHDLAASDDPLRRRSAITAPLWFAKYGDADDLGAGYAVAARLRDDSDPVVRKAAAIYDKHAGRR